MKNQRTCTFAAATIGHLELLQLLQDPGCPIYRQVCVHAIFGSFWSGNLKMLCCRGDKDTCQSTARSGNIEIL
jgi:hypothetical protein